MARLMTRQEFIDKLIAKERYDVELVGDYINTATTTLFRCTNPDCKYEWSPTPNQILSGGGCPACAGKVVFRNVNSAAALRPDLLKYFIDVEEAYNCAPNSHQYVHLKCPDCGATKTMQMYNLAITGFSCKECSAHISYPNRLIRSVMNQLKNLLDYLEYEWSSAWTERFRYDVYFEKDERKYVIEMQGEQHFVGGWRNYRLLDEITTIDNKKKNLAMENNIIPIIIDARQSDFDFIFDNIKKSILGQIFDMSVINTDKCKTDITANIVKLVCDEYQNNKKIKTLAKQFQVSGTTIRKYLKIGTKIGWCQYTPGESSKMCVRVLDVDKNILYEYTSIAECVRRLSAIYNMTFYGANISRACKYGYSCQGLFFEYI